MHTPARHAVKANAAATEGGAEGGLKRPPEWEMIDLD
jgi:hypothetical protein